MKLGEKISLGFELFERARKSPRLFFVSFRHGCISVLCGFIELSMFFVAARLLGLDLLSAHVIGFTLATTFGYFGHSFFTYKVGGISKVVFLKFLLQVGFMVSLGYLILDFYTSHIKVLEFAKLCQLFTTFLLNVLIGRYITFIK